MTRISLLFATLTIVSCLASAKQPNIIVIMTDDTGNNIGYQGNPHVKTPHIDQMASEGVSLSNFHQMPMCTASRAGLMSGQYAEHTGAWRTSLGRTMMRGDVYTIAEAFAMRQIGTICSEFGPLSPSKQRSTRTTDGSHHPTGPNALMTIPVSCGGVHDRGQFQLNRCRARVST